jgi:peptidyl-prolyl cis-trans isomerase D
MLQSIRDRSQGWLTGVIIFLVCAAFALWGIHSYTGNNAQPDIVAKVNRHAIRQADLNFAYEHLRQQQQMQLGADFVFDQKLASQLKEQALNQLIMGQLLTQAAQREGFRVSMAEVGSALLMIPIFQINGEFSRARFNEVLNGMMYSEKQFLADLQTTMLTGQVRSGFVESAFALPSEIETAVRLVNQKRDLGYLIVPLTRFGNNTQISTAEALAYYNQHQTEFVKPEQVSLEYVELSLPQIAAEQHFTPEQLQQFYQNNLSNYTRPERWQVARILVKTPQEANAQQIAAAKARADEIAQHIHTGENFAKLAQTYSDDKNSANKGGALGWISPGTIDPAVEKVISSLAKPGDVSAPVQTKEGFNLIKLLAVEKPQVTPFAKAHAQVEKAMAQQKAAHIFADASDKLSNLTYANPGSLDVAVKTLGLPVKTTDFFDRQGGKDAVTSNPKVIAAAFSNDVLLNNNNSSVIELNPDTLLVLRIKQHKLAKQQPFTEVQNNVVQQLKTQAAKQQAQVLGAQILQQLKQGKNPEQLAQQNKLTWRTVPAATRFSNQASSLLLSAAFRMPRPVNSSNPSRAGITLPNGDYAVLVLTAVHDGIFNQAADVQRRVYREQLENSLGQLDYALYVRGLERKAKIVVTPVTAKSS